MVNQTHALFDNGVELTRCVLEFHAKRGGINEGSVQSSLKNAHHPLNAASLTAGSACPKMPSAPGLRRGQVSVNVTPGEGVEPPAHLVLCLHEISGVISEDLGKVAKNADVAAYSSHKGSGSVVFYDFNIEMACYKAGDQKYPAFLAP